ncbi:class I SAM-dependent methyltransferase [Bacterioplanoides sp.]|uniref:class I SAM-dependent methyltransferase n=1 Tax=Bacterioplanoides sp. TaxID=2066072 RepID=UPI003B59DE56
MSVGELSKALLLPGAQLKQTVTQQLKLWLLDLDVDAVQMDAQQIGMFWQNLPYWAFAWAGGRVLAQYIVDHPHAVEGKRVLDFGCGSGLVGIAAAKAGASEVWVADLDPNALLAAQANAELNGVAVLPVDSDSGWPEVDLLLASDVLYDISSSDDLRKLMLKIPDWLLTENQQVAPDWVQLQSLWQCNTSTLPAIGDFDESVSLQVYGRCE